MFFIVAEKYLRIFARPDMIGKLRSEAAPQVRMACLLWQRKMDLQILIILAQLWEAVEDAGGNLAASARLTKTTNLLM